MSFDYQVNPDAPVDSLERKRPPVDNGAQILDPARTGRQQGAGFRGEAFAQARRRLQSRRQRARKATGASGSGCIVAQCGQADRFKIFE